jgi:hypothetical protein
MARKSKSTYDPWKEMSRNRGNDQVELDEVLVQFEMGNRGARALKKALVARMAELASDR